MIPSGTTDNKKTKIASGQVPLKANARNAEKAEDPVSRGRVTMQIKYTHAHGMYTSVSIAMDALITDVQLP